MDLHRVTILTKVHLIISVIIVLPVAIIYGFDLGDLIELHPKTTDELNFFKAIMSLYVGFAVLWVIGTLNPRYLRAALLSNTVFMLSLALGRVFSILTDGFPSSAYIFGTLGEFILGFYGLWIILKFKK